MALAWVLSFTVLCSFAFCEAESDDCTQCKLLPVKDFASEFRRKASEKGVRLVYLYLTIDNDSYHPRKLLDEFLPDRWVWATNISEPMLSLPEDYDILSLSLLNFQVRNLDVQLEDQPSGCLAHLNLSCRDVVVGQSLLGNVTARNGPGEDVVCNSKMDTSFNFYVNYFDGVPEFRCCNMTKQGILFKCDIGVQRSNWFKAFYAVVNILRVFVGVYSPALFILLPDYIFDVRKECEK